MNSNMVAQSKHNSMDKTSITISKINDLISNSQSLNSKRREKKNSNMVGLWRLS